MDVPLHSYVSVIDVHEQTFSNMCVKYKDDV